jgi:hypothetical protein
MNEVPWQPVRCSARRKIFQMTPKFDYTKQDAMAMPVTPVGPADIDLA